MENGVKKELSALLGGRVAFDTPMSTLTTLKVGGPAGVVADPLTLEELKAVLQYLHERSVPWTVIGNGSNVLVSDSGYSGVVIRLASGFGGSGVRREGGEIRLEAGAAAVLSSLLRRCGDEGYSGLEFTAGIPGTVGGAIAMNAGAFDRCMADITVSVEFVDGTGQVLSLSRDRLGFGYRSLSQDPAGIIIKGVFRLTESTPATVRAGVRDYLRRRAGQPRAGGTAGSVFKNPQGDYAGRLIEQAGLKGFRKGGAVVSQEHANWIVTEPRATAGDVAAIMKKIQDTVFEKSGVLLEPEIVLLGFEVK